MCVLGWLDGVLVMAQWRRGREVFMVMLVVVVMVMVGVRIVLATWLDEESEVLGGRHVRGRRPVEDEGDRVRSIRGRRVEEMEGSCRRSGAVWRGVFHRGWVDADTWIGFIDKNKRFLLHRRMMLELLLLLLLVMVLLLVIDGMESLRLLGEVRLHLSRERGVEGMLARHRLLLRDVVMPLVVVRKHGCVVIDCLKFVTGTLRTLYIV
jgi:hypothetical protein